MKKSIILLIILITSVSCKHKQETKVAEKEVSISEKIAKANGFENWKNVAQINFTFNVDKDTTHFERSWSWKPKTGDVTLISGKDTISYNRKSVDSISLKADKSFINDKFWLLAPFQLVWDSGATISEPITEEAPISKTQLNKITLTYPNEGGYTPGDAYDFYFGDDFIVKEWIFRRGNAKEPTMMTSWENYQDFNGVKIALEHKKPEENWKLYFTAVEVKMN
ncbi:hypothetical protein CJ739_780 [Mariniflexile rhizosphaerae]|uniref:hypothetical protein n=1 Tax=unclassified Mariniflexile TaxID=2643887 RepID=UPI000CA926D1|nr:hypothetical protein [Mariniflexile sp. TRM1-10]AXP79876.1 hypothetical protein CJ739_780 [Mariniflexile sp. TRM1-10]PLB21119.1 MAG: hypothetical protein TRG1_212 [Flavobacteriaceae bacterium FS1-H7996/R]